MKEKLSLLKSEIADDKSRIDRLLERFEEVWNEYNRKKEYSLLVECAFTVNQVYTGVERIFRNIAVTFENNIDERLWHRALLDRMRLDIEDIRPKLLSDTAHDNLNELLAFRHYFRHAYDSDINEDKFKIIAASTLKLKEILSEDIGRFVQFIDELKKYNNHSIFM